MLPLLITLAVCGAYRGSVTIAEPRASMTFWYLAALAAYAPEPVAQGWMLLLIGVVIVAHARGLGGWTWLGGTVINIAFAAVWVPASPPYRGHCDLGFIGWTEIVPLGRSRSVG